MKSQAAALSIVVSKSCEPAALAEPSERALYDPATRQDLEAFCRVGLLDDFEPPCADPAQRAPELWLGIVAVGKDAPKPRIERWIDASTLGASSRSWIPAQSPHSFSVRR
jgi:hypothetical protein